MFRGNYSMGFIIIHQQVCYPMFLYWSAYDSRWQQCLKLREQVEQARSRGRGRGALEPPPQNFWKSKKLQLMCQKIYNLNKLMYNNQSWMLMLKEPFIISRPLTGFDIRWVTSHRASGLQNLLAHCTFQSPRFLTNVLLHPNHRDPGSIAWLWRTFIPLIGKRLLCICCKL